MSAHLPVGSQYKQAAAWELIVASVILFIMICYRIKTYGLKGSVSISSPMSFFKNLMNEGAWTHTFLYFIIFGLVFSSALSFFLD